MRIASLVPSATEIVFALDRGDRLVGRSPECDFPPEANRVPVVARPLFATTDLDSREIDAAVRSSLRTGKELYHIDPGRLRKARPDLILTQGLCEVCAASVDTVRAAAADLPTVPEVVSLDPNTLEDILVSVVEVGRRVGREAEARSYVDDLRARLDRVRRTVAGAPRPRVVCLEWLDPPFAAGHWVPEMVDLAGGRELLGRAGRPSREVPWDAVLEADPDVLVLAPCGFDIPRTEGEMEAVTRRPGWDDLTAVRTGEVHLVNASAYFNRPGPRVVRGVEILAGLLHPDRFPDPPPPRDARRREG